MTATRIPSAWLMGMAHKGRMTIAEAVAYWLEQERMAKEVAQ